MTREVWKKVAEWNVDKSREQSTVIGYVYLDFFLPEPRKLIWLIFILK